MILSKKQDVEDWNTINKFQEIGKYCSPKLQEIYSFLMYWNIYQNDKILGHKSTLGKFQEIKITEFVL